MKEEGSDFIAAVVALIVIIAVMVGMVLLANRQNEIRASNEKRTSDAIAKSDGYAYRIDYRVQQIDPLADNNALGLPDTYTFYVKEYEKKNSELCITGRYISAVPVGTNEGRPSYYIVDESDDVMSEIQNDNGCLNIGKWEESHMHPWHVSTYYYIGTYTVKHL